MTRSVLVVDDHPCLRLGINDLIAGEAELSVVGQASDAREALDLARSMSIDAAVVDLALPDMDGAELIVQLRHLQPRMACVAFTFQSDRLSVLSAMNAGALGYILKTSDPENLLRALASALEGAVDLDPWVTPYVTPWAGRAARPAARSSMTGRNTPITQREGDVLRGFALGLTAKEIARRLDLSVKTVETYKARAATKLSLTSRADIVRYAAGQGWFGDTAAHLRIRERA